MKPFSELWKDSNEAGVQFVMAELELASSFLGNATCWSSTNHRDQGISRARIAYDTIRCLLPRLTLTDSQLASIEAKLRQLRLRLAHFGHAQG